MGRRPEVFVRALSMAEGQRLQKITRTAKDPVKLRRAIVVLMSGQGQPAPDIAHLLKATEDYVRNVIHAFNHRGFDALDPKWSGGTPNKISEQVRDWICVIARCDPRFLGRPFSGWSLSKLLNLVERWFGELTTKKLQRGTHRSVRALNKDIRDWIGTWNDNPRPYIWTKIADQILESVKRHCTRINDSGH